MQNPLDVEICPVDIAIPLLNNPNQKAIWSQVSMVLVISFINRAGLGQSVERLTAEREVAGSIPGPDQYSGS